MKYLPEKLQNKINTRKKENTLRRLSSQNTLVDFSSNDYLGFSKSKDIFNRTYTFLLENNAIENGATGSRLLSGNHSLYNDVESLLCEFHNTEVALVFNSGYTANLGFFSSVPQRGDIIFYDEFIHASIRDGIQMSNAKAYHFKHNNILDLTEKTNRLTTQNATIYIVTESVFSMDGDTPNLKALAEFCSKNNYYFVVDEAHAVGVFGQNGKGLIQELNIENQVFAIIITFGKALGCHGAAILGCDALKQFLINFARPFIYTTALPPHALASIKIAYDSLSFQHKKEKNEIEILKNNIAFFKMKIKQLGIQNYFISSNSAIQSCIISGNKTVKIIAEKLQDQGFDVKPILSPTVSKNHERLRFCLHSYNSEKEITQVLQLLCHFILEH